MREIPSTITAKGQVTIPAEVRKHLALGKGDTIAFVIEDDGSVRVKVPRFPTLASLAGFAGSLPQPMSWDDVRRIAREDRAEERRSRKG